jgi:quinolinate synthase
MTRTCHGSQDRPASVSEGQTLLLNFKKKCDIKKQVEFKAAAEVRAFCSASREKQAMVVYINSSMSIKA